MVKNNSMKQTHKGASSTPRSLKRRIEDLNLTSWNHINSVEHYPKYERICTENIRPANVDRNGSVNHLVNFVFNLQTGQNEILLIEPFNQMTIEGRLYNYQRPFMIEGAIAVLML